MTMVGFSAAGCNPPEIPDQIKIVDEGERSTPVDDDLSPDVGYTEAGESDVDVAARIGTCSGRPGGGTYCSTTCPCEDQEGDCDSDAECVAGHKCMRDIGALFGWSADIDVCMELCPTLGVGSLDFCSPGCPCDVGEGDCDTNADCAAGSVCAKGVGADYGYSADTDVCVSTCDDSLNGTYNFCTPECPCDATQGDCDTNADCAPGLACARNLGPVYGFPADMDVCLDQCDDVFNGTYHFCTPGCPCDVGQGDCDSDADCGPGLVCGKGLGATYGYPADMDVCVNACDDVLNGTYNFCSPGCPCNEGEGDCDSNADCLTGMLCAHNVGADYGFPADTDVCIVAPVEINFAGRVIDPTGQPLSGVTVSVNGNQVATSGLGTFGILVFATDSYVINAEARGFVPSSRVHVGGAINDMVIMMQPAQVFELDPTLPVDVVDDRGTRIELPAGALVDANGNPPQGPVAMQVYTYDITSEGMVGDMSATDSNGAPVTLQSVGAVSVDFFDEAGTEYQLAPGQAAQLAVQVPDDIAYTGAIPLWHYDMAAGRWVEEGVGYVENGVATATVPHFSVWNFDVKFEDPACVQVFVSPGLVQENGSLQARVVVHGPFPSSRNLDLPGGFSAMYNLPPNVLIDVYIPAAASAPLYTLTTGAPWGGTGVPQEPYQECNGQLTVVGPLPGTAAGFVMLEQRGTATGASVQMSSGNAAAGSEILGDSSRYSLTANAGNYSLEIRMPGYLPVLINDVEILGGKVEFQQCVKLRAGDTNEDLVIDEDDAAFVSSLQGVSVGAGHPADFDGNLVIDSADLDVVTQNQGIVGPLQPGDGLSGCYDNLIAESEPNEDGSVQTGGDTLGGNDFSSAYADGPFSANVLLDAALDPAGDEDVFALVNTSALARSVTLETYNKAFGVGVPCDFSMDTVLHVRDAAGSVIAFNDDSVGYCSRLDFTLPAGGTLYIHVTEYGDNQSISGYYLDVRFNN